jgi:hypothetical protein
MTDQGAAGQWNQPEHRRCVHLHESGERCRGTTKTGEKFCHAHQRFADADPMYPVRVPLLEDPGSIRLVASQTVRALAVGTLPPANARSMLYGCRMALDLLLYSLAVEKYRARQRKEEEERAQVIPGMPEGGGPVAVPEPVVVEECAAGCDAMEPDPTLSLEKRSDKDGAPEPQGSGDQGSEAGLSGAGDGVSGATSTGRIGPRFPDLRAEWEAALARSERAVSRNLERKEGESLEAWQQRRRGPIEGGHAEAGHPEARRGSARDPGAEVREGPCGPDELPFDPQCPPTWRRGLTDGWLPEHIAAWYRTLNPVAAEKEVRAFVRGVWDLPRADERAGWRWPAEGEDPHAAPPESCIFRGMSEEEIAAWLRAEVPEATEGEARAYAEARLRQMGRLGRSGTEGAEGAKDGLVVGV